MVKKEIQYNEEGAAPCKHCKRKGQIVYPRIVEISGEELTSVESDGYIEFAEIDKAEYNNRLILIQY